MTAPRSFDVHAHVTVDLFGTDAEVAAAVEAISTVAQLSPALQSPDDVTVSGTKAGRWSRYGSPWDRWVRQYLPGWSDAS